MSLTELLPELRSLPRAEKLRVIQVLATELAETEESLVLESGMRLPVWSPFDAYSAAEVLSKLLAADRGTA